MADDFSPTTTRRVVVVLGMHRSGTSAVAGSLQRVGVDFGPRLMPATEANARGYYEHIDLVNVHDRLLLALGRSWDDTYPFPPGWWRDDALTGRFREDVIGLLRRDFASARIVGVQRPASLPVVAVVGIHLAGGRERTALRAGAAGTGGGGGFVGEKGRISPPPSAICSGSSTRSKRNAARAGTSVCCSIFTTFLADSTGALEAIGKALGQPWPVSPPTATSEDGAVR